MKAVCNEKQYKKQRLSKRIQRIMSFANGINTLVVLILMTIVIGGLVGYLGSGFSSFISEKLAGDVSRAYITALDNREFQQLVQEINRSYDNLNVRSTSMMNVDDETVHSFKDALVENGDLSRLHNIDLESRLDDGIKYFDYSIVYKNMVIYDSLLMDQTSNGLGQFVKDNFITDGLLMDQSTVITDEDGEEIGLVTVSLSTDVILVTLTIAFTIAFGVLLLNTIVNRIITTTTSKIVSKPLEALADQMELMANEELEDAFNTEFDIKRPASEVTSLMSSSDKIMTKMSEYYQTMMAQNQELEAQRDVLADHRDELEAQTDELEAQRDELEAQNEEMIVASENLQSMNSAYLNRTLKLQNLMDNIGQGFLTFGEDLMVNGEYSNVCMLMLCESADGIEGQQITDLLFEDQEEGQFTQTLLKRIFKGSARDRDLFIPLLPDELHNNGRVQHVAYKVVKDEIFRDQIMVILTDITEKRDLEAQMINKRDTLEMIVKVGLNREEFMAIIRDFKAFIASLNDLSLDSDYETTLRTIHTFKGTFAQYYMGHISEGLNELEKEVYKSGDFDLMTDQVIKGLSKALDEDLKVIEGYVGSDFLADDVTYNISEEKLLQVDVSLREALPLNEYNKVKPIVKGLRYKSVKSSLKDYPDYVVKLASRNDKSVAAFSIEGDDVYVDADLYQPILKSLIHVFRNAVDHGIETIDQRVQKGKSETAKIQCNVRKKGNEAFVITIKDDGCGIDSKSLVSKAITAGFITEDEADDMQAEQAAYLILRQGLTTKEKATALSGRGVGLAAVNDLVKQLGGRITINTNEGQGTTFEIEVPIISETCPLQVSAADFMESINKVSQGMMTSMSMGHVDASVTESMEIKLNRHSAILNISGSVNGLVLLSVNDQAAMAMVRSFMMQEMGPTDLVDYAGDVLGEITNTVMGNVLGDLEEQGVYLTIGVPILMTNTSTDIRFSQEQAQSLHYEIEGKIVDIHLLLTDDLTALGLELPYV